MGFIVICHKCGQLLYEGKDMIPLYRLRCKTDGRYPNYNRKLALRPLSINFDSREMIPLGLQKIS